MSRKADGRLQIDYMDLDTLTPAQRNPKQHDVLRIRKSIERYGFADPVELDDRTDRLVVGHGRVEALNAMRDEGTDPPQGVVVDDQGRWLVPVRRGWASRSDADAEGYLVANNQLTAAAGWDESELGTMLIDLQEFDPALLATTGFHDDELENLLAGMSASGDPLGGYGDGGGDEGDDDERESTLGEGELIELAGVTVGEPDHQVKTGQVWRLGDRHVLAVACPHREWQLWSRYLADGAILLPYPSPHATLSQIPGDPPVVLVQPNTYLAGWVVTKWVRVTGGTPELVEGQQ